MAGSRVVGKDVGREEQRLGEAASVAGVTFELQCPHCGAPFVATDDTHSHTCGHCRSLLIVDAPDREEVFIEPAQVKDPAAILETLVRYRVDAHRSTLVGRHTDREGNPPPDLLIHALLARYERGLRASARILECVPIHVPYRQTSAKVVQTTLGRRGDGPKVARVRAYVAEQTTPAYDTTKFNLRDAGLRLGRAVFRPLTSAIAAKSGHFLPRAVASDSRRELEKWRGQNLEAGFESVAKNGQVVVNFEAVVYRPYFIVRAALERGEETILFDGGFGTIGGYIGDDERRALTARRNTDPLGTAGPSFRRVSIIPSRCPNCGADPELPEDALFAVCRNCHAGLSLRDGKLVVAPYAREEGITTARNAVFLPFWRFPFTLAAQGGREKTLEEYASLLFSQARPPGFAPVGDALLVPAFRLLTTVPGDSVFADLSRAAHSTAWVWTTDRIGVDVRCRFLPVSLPEDEARGLGPATLHAIHTRPSSARLNALLLKRFLFDAKIDLGSGMVTFLSFKQVADACERPDMRVPRLLLEGGPALSAQRVTVQGASAEFVAAQKRPSISARVQTSRFSVPEE